MEIKCVCGKVVKSICLINAFDETYSFHCGDCNNLFLARNDSPEITIIGNAKDDRTKLEIPNFNLGDKVMLVDVNHKFFLQTGMVVGLDHKFIRVRFDDKDNTKIWMSSLVIARM